MTGVSAISNGPTRAVTLVTLVAMCVFAPFAAASVHANTIGSDKQRAPERAEDITALFHDASVLFDQARSIIAGRPADAADLFAQAAALYDSCAARSERPSAELFVNAGNAHLLAGQIGASVLAFRRAIAIDPNNQRAREGLTFARSRVETLVTDTSGRQLKRLLLAWRDWVPREMLIVAGVCGYLLLWAAALCWLLDIRLMSVGVAVVVGLVTLGLLLPIVLEPILDIPRSSGVVTDAAVDAWTGPGRQVYKRAFGNPLSEGVEFEVVEQRQGWILGRLVDGRQAWLPREGVALVEDTRNGPTDGA